MAVKKKQLALSHALEEEPDNVIENIRKRIPTSPWWMWDEARKR